MDKNNRKILLGLGGALLVVIILFFITSSGGKDDLPYPNNNIDSYADINQGEGEVPRFNRIVNEAMTDEERDSGFVLMLYQTTCSFCVAIEDSVTGSIDPDNESREVVAVSADSFIPDDIALSPHVNLYEYSQGGNLYVPLIIAYDYDEASQSFTMTNTIQGDLTDQEVIEFFESFYASDDE